MIDMCGKKVKLTWLQEMPNKGIGCTACARLRMEALRTGALKKSRQSCFDTKFGRFEITGAESMQSSVWRLHGLSRVHQRALRLWSEPARPVLEILPEDTTAFDAQLQLLKGAVPQVEDYLFVWRCMRSSLSFYAASDMQKTLRFLELLNCRGGRLEDLRRKTVRKIALVMAEALREEVRDILGKCAAWSVSMDDRKEYRLVNFDASIVQVREDGSRTTCRKKGLLAVLNQYPGTSKLQDAEKDYCIKLAENIEEAIRSVCDGDEDLYLRIKGSLRGCMADGAPAMQRALRFLQEPFPQILLVGRDPAHTVRKSTAEAWQREHDFQKHYDDIWNTKASLVPTIQNSTAWKALLQQAQRQILQSNGSQSSGLQTVLKHLSYAKQRYESQSGPLFTYVLLLVPICMVLCVQATDATIPKKQRERAAAWLENMSPHHAALAGLSADWGLECSELIRLLDVDARDPSQFKRLVLNWIGKQERLFMEGRILEEPVASHEDGSQLASATWTAINNLMECPPIVYQQRVKSFWHKGAKEEVLRAVDSVQVTCRASLDRLLAEFTDNLVCDLSLFDLSAWNQAQQGPPDIYDVFCTNTRRKIVRLLTALHREGDSGRVRLCYEQILGAATHLVRKHKKELKSDALMDNRPLWASFLDSPSEVREVLGLEQRSAFEDLYHVYNAYSSGTSRTERNLGAAAKQLQVHCGPLDDSTMASLTFLACSPLEETSFAIRPESFQDEKVPRKHKSSSIFEMPEHGLSSLY